MSDHETIIEMEKEGDKWNVSDPQKEPDEKPFSPFDGYVHPQREPKSELDDIVEFENSVADILEKRQKNRKIVSKEKRKKRIYVLENVEQVLEGAEVVARLFNDVTKRIERIKGK